MNKDALIKAVSEDAQITRQNASRAIAALFEVIEQSLKQGEAVNLIGFGSFKVLQRPARQGRNPRTGDSLSIAATTLPKFTAGKSLKEAVNS